MEVKLHVPEGYKHYSLTINAEHIGLTKEIFIRPKKKGLPKLIYVVEIFCDQFKKRIIFRDKKSVDVLLAALTMFEDILSEK